MRSTHSTRRASPMPEAIRIRLGAPYTAHSMHDPRGRGNPLA